jgi:hypothetical protein
MIFELFEPRPPSLASSAALRSFFVFGTLSFEIAVLLTQVEYKLAAVPPLWFERQLNEYTAMTKAYNYAYLC